MDGVDLLFDGERDDSLDIEIRLNGAESFARLVGFIGLEAMQAEAVFLRVNRDGAEPQFGGRAHDADGDFSAVQGKEFFH